jgi:hypothetical protein
MLSIITIYRLYGAMIDYQGAQHAYVNRLALELRLRGISVAATIKIGTSMTPILNYTNALNFRVHTCVHLRRCHSIRGKYEMKIALLVLRSYSDTYMSCTNLCFKKIIGEKAEI